MNRDKLKDLILWKNSATRKPLIIRGVRQVGKTWDHAIMRSRETLPTRQLNGALERQDQ